MHIVIYLALCSVLPQIVKICLASLLKLQLLCEIDICEKKIKFKFYVILKFFRNYKIHKLAEFTQVTLTESLTLTFRFILLTQQAFW